MKIAVLLSVLLSSLVPASAFMFPGSSRMRSLSANSAHHLKTANCLKMAEDNGERMGICIGNYYSEAEVNLVDRSRFKYPLLIGRSFMGDRLLIDPSAQFTLEPGCGEQPSVE